MPSPSTVTRRPTMPEPSVRKSLASWQHKRAFRAEKVTFYTHKSKRPLPEREHLRIKWVHLVSDADDAIALRRAELTWYKDHAPRSHRAECVAHAQSYAGRVRESPPNSNRGGIITQWQSETGRGASYLIGQAWCGTFVENMLRDAGVKNTSPRMASVGLIEDDAKLAKGSAHPHMCYRGWTTGTTAVRPGDLVVLFGYGVHVELVVSIDHKRGVVHTVGGNTSAGVAGSQANGGGVYERTRPLTDVRGFALIDYPPAS